MLRIGGTLDSDQCARAEARARGKEALPARPTKLAFLFSFLRERKIPIDQESTEEKKNPYFGIVTCQPEET